MESLTDSALNGYAPPARKTSTARLIRLWRSIPRPLRAATVRAVAGLSNPSAGYRWAAVLLLGYAVLWTISATIRNSSISLHGDMAETFALSRDLSLGYFKHPPLINWITAAWFAIMPVAHWSFYLLAYLNAALAMWAVWLAAGYFLDARRRILAIALLGLTPIFTLHAAVFNHNTLQFSLWALVALSFLASIERTNPGWSVLFGVVCGLAMLAKYFAGVIVLACLLASLLHPNRRSYWRSPRPYLAGVASLAILAPYLFWLIGADFISIRHQIGGQPEYSPVQVIALALLCLAAFVAYLAPALLALWLCLRPSTAMLRSIAVDWPPKRAVIGCIAFAPVALPILAFAAVGIGMLDAWIQPACLFAPLALISAPRLFVPRAAVTLVVASVAALAALAIVTSPILAVSNFWTAKVVPAQPSAPLARFATDLWRNATGRPLEFVSGSRYPAWSVSFYSEDHPRVSAAFGFSPLGPKTENHWREHGTLGICHSDDSWCNDIFTRSLPDAQRLELTLPMTFLGMNRGAVSYILYLMPGRAAPRGGGS